MAPDETTSSSYENSHLQLKALEIFVANILVPFKEKASKRPMLLAAMTVSFHVFRIQAQAVRQDFHNY